MSLWGIAGAYFLIPIGLAYSLALRRREWGRVPAVVLRSASLGAAFVLVCGVSHIVDQAMFYAPAYRLLGVVHAATAVVSWLMVSQLPRFIRFVVKAPDPETVRREVEAAKRPFELAFTNAPNPKALVLPSGVVEQASQSFALMLGTTRADLEGRAFQDFTTPDTLDADLALFEQLKDGRRDSYSIEKAYPHFITGQRIDVHLSVVALERRPDGQLIRCLAQLVDLTEQKREAARADAELQRTHEAKEAAEKAKAALEVAYARLLDRGYDKAAADVEEAFGSSIPRGTDG